jgi:hypothetical protein
MPVTPNSFLGLHEPETDWRIDRTVYCFSCLEDDFGKATTEFLDDRSSSATFSSTDDDPYAGGSA